MKSKSDPEVLRIVNLEKFNLEDFSRRWRAARFSALANALDTPIQLDTKYGVDELANAEIDLLSQIAELKKEEVLKRVFENSRGLGLSATRFLGHTWELQDLMEIIPSLKSPCFAGSWVKHNEAYILQRGGCDGVKRLGGFYCDYWREALDGLVMGVAQEERFVRQRSRGHQDQDCLDVLFLEDESTDRATLEKLYKWGPIPESLKAPVGEILKAAVPLKVSVEIKGYLEGRIYYTLEVENASGCSPANRLLEDAFLRECVKHVPQYQFMNVAPRAVLNPKDEI